MNHLGQFRIIRRRFVEEGRVPARLEHPGIVRVLALLVMVGLVAAGALPGGARAGTAVAPHAEETSPSVTPDPPTPAPPPSPVPYTEDAGVGLGLEMVWVKGGTFVMGSPADEAGHDADERPARRVRMDGFWLGKHEVTQGQYEALMGRNPSGFKGDVRHPVENVSWNDAMEFCRRLSERTGRRYTLPTEAQWEYACRAGSAGRFCFGESDSGLAAYAWTYGNSGNQTHPVGMKRANAWGLHDMHGNVLEWCRDWYGADFYGSPAARARNPENTTAASDRVRRGGSWNNSPERCRSADRDRKAPGIPPDFFQGFRVLAVPVAVGQ